MTKPKDHLKEKKPAPPDLEIGMVVQLGEYDVNRMVIQWIGHTMNLVTVAGIYPEGHEKAGQHTTYSCFDHGRSFKVISADEIEEVDEHEVECIKVFLLEDVIEYLIRYEEHPAWRTIDLRVARDELTAQLSRQKLELELELAS